MLVYCTYKVVVLKRCLPMASWGVTLAHSMAVSVSEDMQLKLTPIILMLYYNIIDFIGSCCRFFIDLIMYFCLRINIEDFQESRNFPLFDKM